VRFDLRDEEAARAFDRLAAETSAAVRASEPGAIAYTMHHVAGEPLARVVYELYRDDEALDEHRRQAHTRRLLTEAEHWAVHRRVEMVEPVQGFG
jgi:quinol monooxygenase YgiN